MHHLVAKQSIVKQGNKNRTERKTAFSDGRCAGWKELKQYVIRFAEPEAIAAHATQPSRSKIEADSNSSESCLVLSIPHGSNKHTDPTSQSINH